MFSSSYVSCLGFFNPSPAPMQNLNTRRASTLKKKGVTIDSRIVNMTTMINRIVNMMTTMILTIAIVATVAAITDA
jgi:hypothetical protein